MSLLLKTYKKKNYSNYNLCLDCILVLYFVRNNEIIVVSVEQRYMSTTLTLSLVYKRVVPVHTLNEK